MIHISDIKLIRTDTTLDLSQKAEKGMLCIVACLEFYSSLQIPCYTLCVINDVGVLDKRTTNTRKVNFFFECSI